MALSTVWYLGPDDVGSHNGGTWIVPGSHRDPRNPRGPDDGIDERAPIKGEMQCHCPAGSVFVQVQACCVWVNALLGWYALLM